jgi:formate-dependent nitrite reductase cytochrome c552 subunit
VEYATPTEKTVYQVPGANTQNLVTRVMDCMDCHNRPTHTFQMPERAVNEAMAAGSISPALPFAKKQAMALLAVSYATRAEARERIPEYFENYYRQNHPDVYARERAAIERSGRGVLAIYNNNVFPHMRVTWGTYPNHLGHTDFPGCYRCHDAEHTSAGGKQITQDCNACHNLLAMDEANPKILEDLGIVTK